MDESVLLKSAKKLDPNALAAIFDIYAPVVYRYCFRFSQDPVESDDLVGVVFSRFLDNLVSGRSPVINLKLYIFQLTYQVVVECIDKDPYPDFRRTRGRIDIKQPLILAEFVQRLEILMQVLISLTTELTSIQRHVLLLRYLEDFSLQETALIVGKNVNDIKVIQNRALTKLRQVLEFPNDASSLSIASGSDI